MATLSTLFSLHTKGDFKDLEGDRLHQLQQSLSPMKYLIINEMPMVGRKTIGQVNDDDLGRSSHIVHKRCLEDAPACCLVTSASFLQS